MPKKETRKKPRKTSNLDKLRKKLPAGDIKVMNAAAVLAATRRRDYQELEEHRRALTEFIKKAGEEYKAVSKEMKSIEDEEIHKLVGQLDRPKWSWW